jgi:SET domain-containing protein
MIVPLLDYLNHATTPNCVVTGYHDKVQDTSFVILQALKDIEAGEQLVINYGNLPNTHLVQKYGFTLKDNPEKKLLTSIPFRELEEFTYEEHKLKSEVANSLGLAFQP